MFKKEYLRSIFLFIILAESLSLAIFFIHGLRDFVFLIICALFLFLSLKDLKYGIYFVLIELILGSKGGYLFYLDLNGTLVSIRIAFWLILLSVWSIKYFFPILFGKKSGHFLPVKNWWLKYFGVLSLFVIWGLINGFLNSNEFSNLFFDFNGYLYLLIILPLISLVKSSSGNSSKQLLGEFIQIITACVLWISTKTLILLFLFAHKLEFINTNLYSWVRSSGVGEITQMEGGFYRIFFQSHIFVMILLILFTFLIVAKISLYKIKIQEIVKDKSLQLLFSSSIIMCATIIVSMSRSNWVGLFLTSLAAITYLIWRFRLRGLIATTTVIAILFLASYAFVLVLVKFPYPKPIGGFNAGDIISERASEFSDEAGVSSRWNLLPELGNKIKEAPLLGSGFGATVTYVSNDPRVRNLNRDGIYTTFAFEWGWLDIWVKLGLIGVSVYAFFVFMLMFRFFKSGLNELFVNQSVLFGMSFGILCLASINFFSPYLNHPLGIGFLLFGLMLYELLIKTKENDEINK